MAHYPEADQVELGYFEPSTQLVARAALSRGYKLTWLNRAFFTFVVDGRRLGVWRMRTDATSSVAAKVVQRRDVTRAMLKRAGLPVAPGRAFRSAAVERGVRFAAKRTELLLLRPATGRASIVADLDASDADAVRSAWQEAAADGEKFVLIEAPPSGTLLRFLVVGGHCLSVVQRKPAETPADLSADDSGDRWETIEISAAVADEYRELAEAVTCCIPGLGLAGVDIVVPDHAKPGLAGDHAVLQLSAAPNLFWHQRPTQGTGIEAADAVLDHLEFLATCDDAQRAEHRVRPRPAAGSKASATPWPPTTATDLSTVQTLGKRFPAADTVEIGYYELSTHLLALEAMRRGHEVQWIHRSMFTLRGEGSLLGFWCTRTDANSAVGAQAVLRKDVTRRLLRAHGISVATGGTYKRTSQKKARNRAREVGYPVVVKPSDGTKGRGVTVGVHSDAEFDRAWEVALQTGARSIIVEELFRGEDARLLVVGDRCVAVTGRPPPQVLGDGHSSIEELIDRANQVRRRNPHLKSRPIVLDPHRLDHLAARDLRPDSIPEAGLVVTIDDKAGMSAGGGSIDRLTDIHPSYLDVATQAVSAFPGLRVAGVDILAADLTAPAEQMNHIVVELNSMPGIGSHHFPGAGEVRDAAGAILDLLDVRSLPSQESTQQVDHGHGMEELARRAGRALGRWLPRTRG